MISQNVSLSFFHVWGLEDKHRQVSGAFIGGAPSLLQNEACVNLSAPLLSVQVCFRAFWRLDISDNRGGGRL